MNFLSHLYLAGNSEGLIIGNFIADAVKGSDFKKYDATIQQGIILHRAIDTFTDTHEIVEQSKQRLREKYKKYASVIIDIYYDHFLAKNWTDYSEQHLPEFTQHIYKIILQNKQVLPPKSAMFSEYMLRYNILENYGKLEGIERVLLGMSRRTTFTSNMEHAIHDLEEHFDAFEKEFKLFFPELKSFVKSKIEM